MAVQNELKKTPPKYIREWLLILSLLTIGLFIYLLFRTDILFIKNIFGSEKGLLNQYDYTQPLPYFLVYCLPDGLWFIALLYSNKLTKRIFNPIDRADVTIIDIIIVLTPFILEFGQLLGIIPGTFDKFDLLTYIISLYIYFKWIRKK